MILVPTLLSIMATLFRRVACQPEDIPGSVILSPQDLYAGLLDGRYPVLVLDVRTSAEFETGHIEGAYLMENLGAYGTANQVSTPEGLMGCEYCNIVIYCRTGARASSAIRVLQAHNFCGQLYNGQGVMQWVNAGYPLVTTGSVPPTCQSGPQIQPRCFEAWASLPESHNQTVDVVNSPTPEQHIHETDRDKVPVSEMPVSTAIITANRFTTVLDSMFMVIFHIR